MSLREYLNNNSAVATIVAVVLLVVSLGIIVWTSGGRSRGPIAIYYYDMNTKKLIQAEGQIAPFDTGSGTYMYSGSESGPAGVQAQVYSCTDSCGDINPGMTLAEVEAAGGHIAYLSRYTMEAKRQMENPQDAQPMDEQAFEMNQQLYANVGSENWVPEMDEAAQQITSNYGAKCAAGQQAKPCLP